jgi:hypothetical protein
MTSLSSAHIAWRAPSVTSTSPKASTSALLLEGKRHLLRLLQEIPLGESEQVAVEDGITAYERLLAKLADVPSPSGKTPRQIGGGLWCQSLHSDQAQLDWSRLGSERSANSNREELTTNENSKIESKYVSVSEVRSSRRGREAQKRRPTG